MKIYTGENNEILRKTAEEIEEITADIKNLARSMKKAMKKEKGIGLAAPQVGVHKRLILVIIGKKEMFMVNPKILSFSAECNTDEEGCLSVPGKFDNVSRSTRISVKYKDLEGNEFEQEFNGLDARVVQHEVDHLNGVLFTDRVSSVVQNSVLETQELVF